MLCLRQGLVDVTLRSMPPVTPSSFLFLFLGITHHSSTFMHLVFLLALPFRPGL